MDSSVDDECVVTDVMFKEKKLKQARLPFQSLSSTETQNNFSAKKRKLTSPVVCRTPKVLKVTAKENSVKDKVNNEVNNESISINSELNNSKDDAGLVECSDTDESNEDNSSNHKNTNIHEDKPIKVNVLKPKKEESKSPMVSCTLTKFFRKVDNTKKEKTTNSNVEKTEKTELTIEHVDNDFNEESREINNRKSCLVTDSNITENEAASINKLDETINSDSDIENEDNMEDENGSDEEVLKSDEIKSPSTPTHKFSQSKKVIQSKQTTPKQVEKKKEIAKRQEEREKRRMEKERQREERENRRKEKEEKRKEKLEKEKAEKEQKMKEKALKEYKKQMEIKQKQKEKEAKEQERRKREEAKEEEKKRKEEEKLEAERKMQKTVSNFASFFVPKKHETKFVEEEANANIRHFMPFEIKADMKVAPISRRSLNENEKLIVDRMFNQNDTKKCDLYLSELKTNRINIRKSGKTWPLEAKDEVVILDEEENDNNANVVIQPSVFVHKKNHPKLLQFYENRRPPYWGTWRKRSSTIKPCQPFSKDPKWFDYEVDSDEEWEEEEPGESLHGSEDEKDEENPDDNEYDVDNEFIVPHGYLSDEEARADEEDSGNLTPETQKFKLKLLGEEFEAERNTKTLKLRPKVIDCIWLGSENVFPENTPTKVVEFLKSRQAWVFQIPVTLGSPTLQDNVDVDGTTGAQGSASAKKARIPEEALPDLIRLVHGNIHGRKFLAKEFLTYWKNKEHDECDKQISKASVLQKIREIGKWMPCPEEGQMYLKSCWYVSAVIREKYLSNNADCSLPNRWDYNLTPKRKIEITEGSEKVEKEDKDKKNLPLITQFTKKITQEEMKQQLTLKSTQTSISKSGMPQQKAPKRAILISLPRKEEKRDVPVNKKKA